jgi:hypothetical protein
MRAMPSLSVLARLGGAIGRWFLDRVARPARPLSIPVIEAEDRIPGGDGANGLAAFYAWQMAASRIEPVH